MNADLMARVLPPLPDRLDMDDWTEIDDVLEAANAWSDDGMPLEVFAKVGTMLSPATGRSSPGYTRHVAVRVTQRDDPRRAPLLRAFDALLDYQGFVRTLHGIFAPTDLPDIPIKYRQAA